MKITPVITTFVALLVSVEAVTQKQAEDRFKAAGIRWSSSGGCTDKRKSTCTSFDGLRENTVAGAVTLKGACKCDLTITGGTETGHANQGNTKANAHWNGWKLDFKKNDALNSYVKRTFTKIGNRGDGYPQWKSNAGNIYCDEGNHWDVVYV